MKVGFLALLGLILIATTTVRPTRPILIWNASASVPVGLYLIVPKPLRIGDFVLVRPPEAMQVLATKRKYIGPDTPLLKRVAAMNGELVCRHQNIVSIDRRFIVIALTLDRRERVLPVWSGCYHLRKGQVFVLGTHLESFDSRYFGPLCADQIVGPAIPLLTVTSP
jgi:conjugative transfer signal peptidase TraF